MYIYLRLKADVRKLSLYHTEPKIRKYNKIKNNNKKFSYCVMSVEILPIATQQCRNYLYDKS